MLAIQIPTVFVVNSETDDKYRQFINIIKWRVLIEKYLQNIFGGQFWQLVGECLKLWS